MLKTTVLIVGGGPAGATAARFLSAGGVDSILVERDFSYVKPCGGGMPSGAFREFDLPEHLIRKVINKILIVSPSDCRIDISLNGGAIYITERGNLDSSLRRMAQDEGAFLIEGEFLGCEKNREGYTSRIRQKSDGTEIKTQSEYILAADGITFSTGRKIGRPGPKRLYTISSKLSGFDGDTCEFWFGTLHASRFYSWVFPALNHASIGTGGMTPRECPELLNNFINRRFGIDSKQNIQQIDLGKSRIFPLPSWQGGSLGSGKVLFLGDAAGMVMPVTYEGIYYAMKSGEFAATAVIERRPELYRRLWQERFRKRFMVMDSFSRLFFKNDDRIEKWLAIHKSAAIQELAVRLWLHKETGNRQLFAYLKAFSSLLIP